MYQHEGHGEEHGAHGRTLVLPLKAMGFMLMNRAGNHLLDSGVERLFETTRLMEDAGLVYAAL